MSRAALLAEGTFAEGLQQLGSGAWAWLQPGGGFCLSNAGLVTDSGASLLIDTLIDLDRTRAMLDAMAAATPAAVQIDTLVNTHADPDHTAGNTLMGGSRILMTNATAKTYSHIERMAAADAHLDGDARLMWAELGGDRFDLSEVRHVPPTQTFDQASSIKVGHKTVDLMDMGPAHSGSDLLVHVPEDGIVYTGDLMFADCHPVINHPNIGHWIRACETLIAWNAAVYVPGHGRVCNIDEVKRHLDYALFLKDQVERRYQRGLLLDEAADDIFDHLGRFAYLRRGDFLYQNVAVLYEELGGQPFEHGFAERMATRWKFRNKIRGRAPGIHHCHVPDGN